MEYIRLSDIGEIVEETDAFTKVRITVWGEGPNWVNWKRSGVFIFFKDQMKDGMIHKKFANEKIELFEAQCNALENFNNDDNSECNALENFNNDDNSDPLLKKSLKKNRKYRAFDKMYIEYAMFGHYEEFCKDCGFEQGSEESFEVFTQWLNEYQNDEYRAFCAGAEACIKKLET